MQALHLGAFGLKDILHFGLLIGSELELFGQFLGAPGGIGGPWRPRPLSCEGGDC